MADRAFNFSAGPAQMPDAVLRRIRDDLPVARDASTSVLEMPFTGTEFRAIAEAAEARLRALLGVPGNYKILFLHGGAMAMFALVPLNLLRGRRHAAYVDSGYWAARAIAEARRYCDVRIAADNADCGRARMPPMSQWRLDPDSAYCHVTSNETVDGLEYSFTPETGDVPLVADMTSNFLTRPVDVSRYGLIYASAQKNVGPTGLAIVIVREDLLGAAHPLTPSVFDFARQGESRSMLNTPNTFAVYVASLVFEWIAQQGGIAAMEEAAIRRSRRIYSVIDAGSFYRCSAAPDSRSRTTVCFQLADPSLVPEFLAEAEAEGLSNLKGHKAVGGLRAALYNAMPEAGAERLASFMEEFARRRG
ncbi:MAG: 3-phosphoserine/phosphohydroxythreonine transaminase [Alphaproteobacteria bacterium]